VTYPEPTSLQRNISACAPVKRARAGPSLPLSVLTYISAFKLKQFWHYLIAAVDLGIGLLQQGHPELIGVQAVSVAIHTLPHWQPAIHSLLKKQSVEMIISEKNIELEFRKGHIFLLSLYTVLLHSSAITPFIANNYKLYTCHAELKRP
jgi:hypothetical protein